MRDIEFRTYGQTIINPLALLITLAMGIYLLFAKRQRIIVSFIIVAAFITTVQRLVIAGLDFSMLRIMVIFGILRILVTNEYKGFKPIKIDKAILAWSVTVALIYIIRTRTSDALVYQLGNIFDVIGMYFLIRIIIRDRNDVIFTIECLVFVSIILSSFMLIEQLTQHNYFAIFGGVREITWLRDGKLRAQGSFSHPIMMGTFGATTFPLIYLLYQFKKYTAFRTWAIIGMIASIVICITANSSGALIGLFTALIVLSLWRLRFFLQRYFLKLFFLSCILFEISLPGHFWNILKFIDLTGGSTGGHRAILITAAVNNLPEWFLMGVNSTAHWGWGLQDITNMYIAQGVSGGILGLFFFIRLLHSTYTENLNSIFHNDTNQESEAHLRWIFFATLNAHIVSFFGISYFGQMVFFFYLFFPLLIAFLNKEQNQTENQ